MAQQHVKDIKALKLTKPFGVDKATSEKPGTIYSVLHGVFNELGSIAEVVAGLDADHAHGGRTQFCEKTHEAAKELRILFQAIATLIRKGASPKDVKELFESNQVANNIRDNRDSLGTFRVNLEKQAAEASKKKGKNKVELGDLLEKLNGIVTPVRNELMLLLKKYADP